MLAEGFSEDQVALVGEELETRTRSPRLPFNHIVFTGSPAVGRLVMRTAAANLTPVTLELGGKSPAVVLPDFRSREAAARITHGKSTNSGQICVSPDYALVPRGQVGEFVDAVQKPSARCTARASQGNHDYTASSTSASTSASGRCWTTPGQGRQSCACGEAGTGPPDAAAHRDRRDAGHAPDAGRDLRPHPAGGRLRQRSTTPSHYINAGPRPLALYCFSHERAATRASC